MRTRSLGERLGAELAAKTAMLLAMAAGVVVPYFGLQRWRPFPAREPFVTPLDALVPFSPDWAPAYLSVCLLVPLFPLLAQQREDVWRFGRGIFWLCLPCFAFFLLAPMPGPRPAAAAGDGLYGWLIGVDATWNSFPSLHAGLVVFSFLYGWRVLGGALDDPADGLVELADGADLDDGRRRDRDVELLLELDAEVDEPQRIDADVLVDARLAPDVLGVDAEEPGYDGLKLLEAQRAPRHWLLLEVPSGNVHPFSTA